MCCIHVQGEKARTRTDHMHTVQRIKSSLNINSETVISLLHYFSSECQSYITTDSQSASLSWCQAPIWDPRPIFSLTNSVALVRERAIPTERQPLVGEVSAPSLFNYF
jgi:hypothetical protein